MPVVTVPVEPAYVNMEVKIGPTHGVHATAKAIPKTTVLNGPRGLIFALTPPPWKKGNLKRPINDSPKIIIITAAILFKRPR